jgi:4-hydroxybenzoate polyprenyltransferase
VLAGAGTFGPEFAVMLLAFSLFYTGGMFLNDAFDAEFDAAQRPERPIPSGEVSGREVYGWGYGMMAAGIAFLAVVGLGFGARTGIWPALAGALLAATIHYDGITRATVRSVVMGCAGCWYLGADMHPSRPSALWIGAGLMLCYLIGLTYVAKQENLGKVENLWPLIFLAAPVAYGAWLATMHLAAGIFWLLFTGWLLVALWFLRRRNKGDIPRAVVSMIAGISLLDAMLIAGAGSAVLAVFALAGFGVTLFLQRYISGT